MRIAVDLRLSFEDQIKDYKYFVREVFIRLAQEHTEHKFLFFSDDPPDANHPFSFNGQVFIPLPKSTIFLIPRWLRDLKISGNIKKNRADIFISTDGTCNPGASIAQLMLVPDVGFKKYPAFSGIKFLFSRQGRASYVNKAKIVVTLSETHRQRISGELKINPEKIVNIGIAASADLKTADWREKENIKERYTASCEYFIFTSGFTPANNLFNLLKAFTLFKKRQRTNMKLVIAVAHQSPDKDTSEKLKSYKLKNEIRILNDLTALEVANLVAGAYAFVNPFLYEATGFSIVDALQSEVPVIVSDRASFKEIAADAALYVDPEDPSSIAEQLKIIFKDENLRSSLIQKGKLRASGYSWQKTTKLLMQAIEQAVSN